MGVWDNFCHMLKNILVFEGDDNRTEYLPDREILDHAKRDWLIAERIFQEVSNPDLIDYAIYNLKAAEKRYMYLLKHFRVEAHESVEFTRLKQSNSA